MDDKETTTTPEDDGVQSEANKKVEQLNAETERINQAIAEKANAEAQAKLAGVAEAGGQLVKKTDDEKWAEGAKERYAGTGMSPVEDQDGE